MKVISDPEHEIRRGLSHDESYARYFIEQDDEELADRYEEIIEHALHYLDKLYKKMGFEDLCRIARFDEIMTARIKILEMLIRDCEPDSIGVFERMKDRLLIEQVSACGDRTMQSFIVDMSFRLTPEARDWFCHEKLTMEELFQLSPGTLLPA